MATRGRTSFLKKQKEMDRKDRRQRKAEIREQRKLARADSSRVPQDIDSPSEEGTEAPDAGREQVQSWNPPLD